MGGFPDISTLADLAYVGGLVLAVLAAPLLVAIFFMPVPSRSGVVLSAMSVMLLAFALVAGDGGYGLIEGPDTFLTTIAKVAARF
jgi:hypothetical protein